jgi:cytochrome d ubiquinol oxidase subunit I
MVGLGTVFYWFDCLLAALQLFRKKAIWNQMDFMGFVLHDAISYIANTTGWYTSELGRQPWLVYIYYEHQKEYRPQFLQGTPCLPYWGL